MARLIINGKDHKGYLTASTKSDASGNVFMIGEMFTHCNISEINKIETDRYIFSDVTVTGISVGTNDFFIKYDFECLFDDFIFKGGESNLSKIEIRNIEKDLFKEEVNEKFHKQKRGEK